ncbi:MAG: Mov34/MPN/PAD-1 family protein, partial [Promethearchaeota archaeon]
SSGVFFPSRIPFDLTLKGTVHSHPSGNPYPSFKDLEGIFKKMQFHFIVGYPYNLKNTKCFDRIGNELTFKVIN